MLRTLNRGDAVETKELFPKADALLDFHTSDWGSTMHMVSFGEDYTDPSLVTRSRALAKAFGAEKVTVDFTDSQLVQAKVETAA